MRLLLNVGADISNNRKDEKYMGVDKQQTKMIRKEVTYVISCVLIILSHLMAIYSPYLLRLDRTAIYLPVILGSMVLSIYSLVDLKIVTRRISDISYIISMLLTATIYLIMFLYRPELVWGWELLYIVLIILSFILVVISSINFSRFDKVIQWKKICISLMLLIVPSFALLMTHLLSSLSNLKS